MASRAIVRGTGLIGPATLLACAAPGVARSEAPAPPVATCSYPVTAADTAETLLARFGKDARQEMLEGAEGTEFAGLALWPDDPARRVEVIFAAEDGTGTAASIRLWDETAWTISGLALGDPLARAREINGKPFRLLGFEWDYGGYVSDLGGGALGSLPGGCRVMLRFGPGGDGVVADELVGDVELSSDDRRVAAADARIEELSLAFPIPEP